MKPKEKRRESLRSNVGHRSCKRVSRDDHEGHSGDRDP